MAAQALRQTIDSCRNDRGMHRTEQRNVLKGIGLVVHEHAIQGAKHQRLPQHPMQQPIDRTAVQKQAKKAAQPPKKPLHTQPTSVHKRGLIASAHVQKINEYQHLRWRTAARRQQYQPWRQAVTQTAFLVFGLHLHHLLYQRYPAFWRA